MAKIDYKAFIKNKARKLSGEGGGDIDTHNNNSTRQYIRHKTNTP